jgi:predicted Zn-dependent protease
MSGSGFDPHAMISVLKKIQNEQLASSQEVPPYLLTHPGANERMANIDIMMAGYINRSSPTEEVIRLRKLFPFFKLTIAVQYGDQSYWERTLSKKLSTAPDSVHALFGMGLLKKTQMDYEGSIQYLRKALSLAPNTMPIVMTLARVYQLKGDYSESLRLLNKGLELSPNNMNIIYMSAINYQRLEQYEKAIPLFERLIHPVPYKNQVLYNLGICYGRRGQLAKAHYYFGLFFRQKGMKDKAKLHFKKALELSNPRDMEIKRKIERELDRLP